MVDVLRDKLTAFAEYSNLVSVVVIVTCFLIMVVFIVRMNNEMLATRTPFTPGQFIPAQAMKGAYNPYIVKLRNEHQASLQDGVDILVTCKVPNLLQVLWGVNINDIHESMCEPWQQLIGKIQSTDYLNMSYMERGTRVTLPACEERTLHVVPPGGENAALDLGGPPRDRYPLIVMMTELPSYRAGEPQDGNSSGADTDTDCEDEWDKIVMMVTMIHLPDAHCPAQSHIIGQYVRTQLGYPYNLKQLYVASSPHTDDPVEEPVPSRSSDVQADPVNSRLPHCIVCQTAAITRALLPCRHACMCDSCFSHMDKCPMCRSIITSYFKIDGNNQTIDWSDFRAQDNAEDPQCPQWWASLNQTINNFFGFR